MYRNHAGTSHARSRRHEPSRASSAAASAREAAAKAAAAARDRRSGTGRSLRVEAALHPPLLEVEPRGTARSSTRSGVVIGNLTNTSSAGAFGGKRDRA